MVLLHPTSLPDSVMPKKREREREGNYVDVFGVPSRFLIHI